MISHYVNEYNKNGAFQAIEKIRRDVGTNPIWVSIDETTDKCGRYVANVLIGALKKDGPSKCHLICSRQLEKTNNATITKTVLDALGNLTYAIAINMCQYIKMLRLTSLLFLTCRNFMAWKQAGSN